MKWFSRRDRELQDEIRAHIEMELRDNLDRGMPEPQARVAAQRKFGSVSAVREELRQGGPFYWLETTLQDVHYAVRSLLRTPLLTAAVVLTLTLGMGLTTAVYTLIRSIAFRARIDKDPSTYVRLLPEYVMNGKKEGRPAQFSLADFTALGKDAQSLTELAGWQDVRPPQSDGEPLRCMLITRNFFPLYGLTQPRLGRLFTADEYSTEPRVPIAILSEEFWRDRYAADAALIGQTIQLNGRAVVVVGIAPPRFAGRINNANAWLPASTKPLLRLETNVPRKPDEYWLSLGGRLAPGYTRSHVQAEMATLGAQLDRQHAGRKTSITVTDGSWVDEPGMRQRSVWMIPLIFAALHMVLAIACANVTALLLSRATARQREIAIRLSLGAGRWRLIRMMLTESVILSAVAGAVSLWLANILPEPIMLMMRKDLPSFSISPDTNVFSYIALISLAAGVIAGLAPALESLNTGPAASLKGLGSIFGGSGPRSRTSNGLVATQVALSMVLLTGAAIFLLSYMQLFGHVPKLNAGHVLTAMVRSRSAGTYRDIARKVETVTGVDAIAFTDTIPLMGQANTIVHVPGEAAQAVRPAQVWSISAGYFQTFQMAIVAGRDLLEQDATITTGALPAVVSQQFASTLWKGQDPLGRSFATTDGPLYRVVGVAGDSSLPQLMGTDAPVFYRAWNPSAPNIFLMARFSGDPASTTTAVRIAIRDVSPENLVPVRTLQTFLDEASEIFSSMVQLVGMLGAIALVLALIGIYGVVSFSVTQRTKEMGIRVAIGATRANIFGQVLRSGRRAVSIGLVVGLALSAVGASVLLKAFQNSPIPIDVRNPTAYIGVCVLLSLAAAVAMMGPAWRACKADPLVSLRHE